MAVAEATRPPISGRSSPRNNASMTLVPRRPFRRFVGRHQLRQPAPVPLPPRHIEREYHNKHDQPTQRRVAHQRERAVPSSRAVAPPQLEVRRASFRTRRAPRDRAIRSRAIAREPRQSRRRIERRELDHRAIRRARTPFCAVIVRR